MPTSPEPDRGDNRPVLSVSELNRRGRMLLEASMGNVWVRGEISGFRQVASGHWYFTLKDDRAQLRCAMFRSRNRLLRFRPTDGMEVIIRATISLFEERGEYQAVTQHIEPFGEGSLRIAFEQLRQRLAAEGLFAADRKRPLPGHVRHLAVITARDGAAFKDIIAVAARRNRTVRITLLSVKVQGEDAPASICAAFAALPRLPDVDVVICGRGGGSLEDLWAFNDEAVARAIAACPVPVISAVGHEVDFTIADLAADLRAPTPSAAAEMVLGDQSEMHAAMDAVRARLTRQMTATLGAARIRLEGLERRLRVQAPRPQRMGQRLDDLEQRLTRAAIRAVAAHRRRLEQVKPRLKHPGTRLTEHRTRLDGLEQRLRRAMAVGLLGRRESLEGLARAMHAVSPLDTLRRGYAIVTREGATTPLVDATSTAAGERVVARLARGRLTCRVERVDDEPQ